MGQRLVDPSMLGLTASCSQQFQVHAIRLEDVTSLHNKISIVKSIAKVSIFDD